MDQGPAIPMLLLFFFPLTSFLTWLRICFIYFSVKKGMEKMQVNMDRSVVLFFFVVF